MLQRLTRPSQATLQGAEAVEAVLDATPDSPSPVIGIQENRIQRQPLMDAVKKVSAVNAIKKVRISGC